MPRDGSNIYSKPSGTTPANGDDTDANAFNLLMDDIAADLNAPRPISAGGTGASTGAAALTALGGLPTNGALATLAEKPKALAALRGFTSTATAGATTALTSSSAPVQIFTGTLSQVIALPSSATLAVGWWFEISNNSTGVLSVQSSGGNAVFSVPASTTARLTCILASGTSAASWDAEYCGFDAVSGTGAILRTNNPVLNLPYSYSPAVYVEAAISAGANAQGQGPFDGDITVITTAAVAPSGVTLPIARLGRTITVINRGANPVNIYPAVGAAIVGKATNVPHLLAVAGRAVFSASSVTQWHVFSPATEAEAVALVNNTGFMTPYLMRLALNATGDAPTFATRAWATFNGTGTLAALSSGGVASITDLGGVGRYRVTLSHAAPHANYAVSASCSKTNAATESTGVTVEIFNRTTTTFDIATTDPTSNTNDDAAYVAITVVY